MLINLRNALMGKRKPTAKDYVQNGLVAMWDGIENAGWGVHDASATTWEDLVGQHDLTIYGPQASWGDSCFNFDGDDGYAQGPAVSGVVYCEACCGISAGRWMYQLGLANFAVLRIDRQYLIATSTSQTGAGEQYPVPHNDGTPFVAGYNYSTNKWAINGAVVNGEAYSDWWNNGNYTAIGRRASGNYVGTGRMCCLRAYSRALTADEIARNYAIDKARFGLP